MNKNSYLIILITFLISCNNSNDIILIPIIDTKKGYVGDSCFIDDKLYAIKLYDSLRNIDSIIFSYHENGNLKNKLSYFKGKMVYENIAYYKNGQPAIYQFTSVKSENYFYEILYDTLGNIKEKNGKLFFQGFVDKINENLEVVDDGNDMHLSIYYPNIPKTTIRVYVKFDEGDIDVFKQNEYINYLKEVWIETNIDEKEWTIVDVWMEEIYNNDTIRYNKPLYFKVVK